jgi:hypothetical protein
MLAHVVADYLVFGLAVKRCAQHPDRVEKLRVA